MSDFLREMQAIAVKDGVHVSHATRFGETVSVQWVCFPIWVLLDAIALKDELGKEVYAARRDVHVYFPNLPEFDLAKKVTNAYFEHTGNNMLYLDIDLGDALSNKVHFSLHVGGLLPLMSPRLTAMQSQWISLLLERLFAEKWLETAAKIRRMTVMSAYPLILKVYRIPGDDITLPVEWWFEHSNGALHAVSEHILASATSTV